MQVRCFLPDFCGIRPVFVTVVSAELLAFVVTLVSTTGWMDRIDELALNSLFIQWVALTCALVLCLARPRLAGARDITTAAVALLVVAGVTWLLSEMAVVVLAWSSGHASSDADRALFLLRNVAVALIVAAFTLRHMYLQHQWQRRVESESEARIEALQARIRPHFLFNCMNTIASLTRTDPRAAEAAIEDLSDLFRASLADARVLVALDEELDLCRRYLHIESLRLGPRLRVEWQIDALPRTTPVPRLTLQPLVENAIYHGIEPSESGGIITITGALSTGSMIITIENPLPSPAVSPRSGNRMALANVRERLQVHFGQGARLDAGHHAGRYRVELHLPCPVNCDESADR